MFVSGTLSNRLQDQFFKQGIPFGFAVQKFCHLYLEGFKANNVDVEVLSLIPVAARKMPYRIKRFPMETEEGVTYRYVPFIRSAAVYHIFVFFYILFRVWGWCLRNRKDGFVFYDVLIPSRCLGTSLGALLGRGKTVALVTDMPGLSGGKRVKSIYRSDFFVFLTRQMDPVLNPYHHPSIVVEALVSAGAGAAHPVKNITRDILDAGGIVESYGLGVLCDAFMTLEDPDLRLVFYGDGPYVPAIKDYSQKDDRIVYMGTAKNDVVFEAEKRATLLVNPRFTGADYTRYSFPSKNIEYMVTGTPIVTTRLVGIPEDHMPYIYTFDEETKVGFAATIRRLLSLPPEELRSFGNAAQEYVLRTKNAVVQVRRVLDMINGKA